MAKRTVRATRQGETSRPTNELNGKLFSGGGELGERIRVFDWSQTPMGPVSSWPQSLKTIVRMLVTSRFAMWMGWGPDLTFLYNDAYARMTLGKKHPWALGRASREVWAEIWNDISPRIEKVLKTGEATWDQQLQLFLERSGYSEETYHTFSYSPLTDDDGTIVGHLCVVTEETDRVIGERRVGSLRSLASELGKTITQKDVFAGVHHSLSANPQDLPFTLTYLFSEDQTSAHLACTTGIETNHRAAPKAVELNSGDRGWPLAEVLSRKDSVILEELEQRFGSLPKGAWDKTPGRAMLVPIAGRGQGTPAGVFIAGLNPYRQIDTGYTGFLDLTAGQIAAAIANARAYDEERNRAEALAEINRAKTAFFTNVSHEFRTPLTLMLGPTQDALSSPDRALSGAELETVHRNELRLLKLVNTLLDFSRLEADRMSARFQPVDLCMLTRELASVFRSAVERAGLSYVVDCDQVAPDMYVDPEMWEKIVLNLLSNALKSTFEGAIRVQLHNRGNQVELSVVDTGTGIPEKELSHLFERFRRIEGAKRRTHEGSGIGLALVDELVKMHGGSIAVKSKVGQGTTFTVRVPVGKSHLRGDQTRQKASSVSTVSREAFLQEALGWLPGQSNGTEEFNRFDLEEAETLASERKSTGLDARVLVADDNRDMLQYVSRLLSQRFNVTSVANGRSALEAARKDPPDLVLSDIMMPEMDGFQLLEALRKEPVTASVPVILLSARAGEEARVEGMTAGADDYLVKPFTARELLARVEAHIKIARFRREAVAREMRLERELEEARRLAAESLENISDAFLVIDSEWRITYVNPAAQRLATAAAGSDARPGVTLWQTLPDLLGSDSETNLRRCMEHRTPVDFETIHGGRTLHFRLHPAPEGGMVIYIADLTARRKAESALRVKHEHLRLTQQAAKIGQWELNLDDEELSISPEFAEIAGLPSYVLRLRYSDFLNALFLSSDRQQTNAVLQQAIRGKTKEFSLQLRLKRPDGEIRLVSNRGKVFYNQGKPVVLGVLVDITPAQAEQRPAQSDVSRQRRATDSKTSKSLKTRKRPGQKKSRNRAA